MSDESYDYGETLETDEEDIGISPLGVFATIVAALVALAFYTDPNSSFYDIRLAGLVIVSIAVGGFMEIKRYENWEYDLRKTVTFGLLGSGLLGITALVFNLDFIPSSILATTSLIGLLAYSLPAVFEEITFRGAFFKALRDAYGGLPATIIQAAVFALWHSWVMQGSSESWDVVGVWLANLDYLLILFIGGIILQVIVLITKDLFSSMIAHFLNNMKAFLPALLLDPIILIVVVLGVSLYILQWRYFNSE